MFFDKGYRMNQRGELVTPSGIIRQTKMRKDGYNEVSFKVNGHTHHILIHRFCAYQKYGEIIFMADCVRHLDGDKTNNTPDNIEIGTDSDNAFDVLVSVRKRRAIHAAMHQKGYHSSVMVDEIKDFYASTKSYKLTMEKYGISSKGTLYYLLNKRVS